MPWKVFQPNPSNLITGDCTVRAICAVTGLDWKTAHKVLCDFSREIDDMPSENRVWWRFFRAIGFRQFRLPDTCPDCYTVRDFARDHPSGKYVLWPMQHAVAVINGDWWDSFDSGNAVPLVFFEEEKDHGNLEQSVSDVSAATDIPVSADAAAPATGTGTGD